MKEEFGLDPVTVNKRFFTVNKTSIPEHGHENIELLDYLLYLRSNETEEEILEELNDIIFQVAQH